MVMDPRYEEYYWQWYPYWDHSYGYDYRYRDGFSGPRAHPSLNSTVTTCHTSAALSVPSNSDDSNDGILSDQNEDTTTPSVKVSVCFR